MSKMIKKMEELLVNTNEIPSPSVIDWNDAIEECIKIAKKHKKKKKSKCEWVISKYSAYELMFKNDEHNGKLLMFSNYDENPYKYCPYCGKKIKVVETE